MTTSNSTDWSLNRDQVITAALRKLAVLPSGGTASTAQISDASDALNALIKSFQADGMPVWKMSSQGFNTIAGTSSYTVGPGQMIICPKPLRVIQAFWTPSGGVNIPLNVTNRYDFQVLPAGATFTGVPVNIYYQPLRTTGILQLWPTPNDSTTLVTFHYQSPYEDMDVGVNDFDFPSEWIQPLIYNLAWSLAPEYGIPPTDRGLLQKEAEYWHQKTLEMGQEEGSIFFSPEWR